MKRAVNPVFFTYFVKGVAKSIGQFLDERGPADSDPAQAIPMTKSLAHTFGRETLA